MHIFELRAYDYFDNYLSGFLGLAPGERNLVVQAFKQGLIPALIVAHSPTYDGATLYFGGLSSDAPCTDWARFQTFENKWMTRVEKMELFGLTYVNPFVHFTDERVDDHRVFLSDEILQRALKAGVLVVDSEDEDLYRVNCSREVTARVTADDQTFVFPITSFKEAKSTCLLYIGRISFFGAWNKGIAYTNTPTVILPLTGWSDHSGASDVALYNVVQLTHGGDHFNPKFRADGQSITFTAKGDYLAFASTAFHTLRSTTFSADFSEAAFCPPSACAQENLDEKTKAACAGMHEERFENEVPTVVLEMGALKRDLGALEMSLDYSTWGKWLLYRNRMRIGTFAGKEAVRLYFRKHYQTTYFDVPGWADGFDADEAGGVLFHGTLVLAGAKQFDAIRLRSVNYVTFAALDKKGEFQLFLATQQSTQTLGFRCSCAIPTKLP
ncbi:hypothetical protein M3Y99_00942800 [Aphelenchoides fujianensis]|nr:hypothetical protein M3Y99_00942800 [Aphelenchoides fujianensis]